LPLRPYVAVVATRRVLLAALVGAAALVAAAFAITRTGNHAHDARQPTSGPDPVPTRRIIAPSTSASSSRQAVPRPSTTKKKPESKPTRQSQSRGQPPRAAGTAFSLTISTGTGAIRAAVAPISVASNQPVDPPHETAAQWNTAAWVTQSAYPSAHSRGTSYVYGHACHYHQCSFTRLKDARVGDRVIATTARAALSYRIERIGISPKSAAALPSWAADSTVPNRLILVTCAYEQGDTSTSNIVVVARLQSA
jgi:LPXTG-site transpeptidase (sortase) family protein